MVAAFHKDKEHRPRHPGGTDKAVRAHFDRSRAGRVGDALWIFNKLLERIWKDLRNPAGLSPRFWLTSWRRGFWRFSFRIYGFDRKVPSKGFLSDIQFLRTFRINGKFREIVDNKAVFHSLMIHYGLPAPEFHGLIRGGRFFASQSGESMPAVDLPARFLPEGGRLVIKPIWGYLGTGFLCLKRDPQGVSANGSRLDPDRLENLLAGMDLRVVTGFVTQGRYGTALFPDTTNTLRIVTLIDPDDHEPFIARAVQRIGNARSFPVDNFAAGRGGLSALVDLSTGRLGPAALVGERYKVTWHDRHPETGAAVAGVEVPNWSKMKAGILEYARRFAYAPCIAWDIAVTEPGFMIIEGNSAPGMRVLQVHGPLLTDPRVRRFYFYHRVLR